VGELDRVAGALREIRSLSHHARRTKRALRALEEQLDSRTLGEFVLGPGERVDGEVLDLLRLAVDGHEQEVHITVTAPRGGTDHKEMHHEQGL